MLYYFFGGLLLFAVAILIGSIMVMSILTNIGIKYTANITSLGIWALIVIVLSWVFWINAT